MFNTKLLDKFHEALFSTNVNGYSSAAQNAKTDYLFECDSFEAWLVKLIKVFAQEASINPDLIKADVLADQNFTECMEAEYAELLELCADDEE